MPLKSADNSTELPEDIVRALGAFDPDVRDALRRGVHFRAELGPRGFHWLGRATATIRFDPPVEVWKQAGWKFGPGPAGRTVTIPTEAGRYLRQIEMGVTVDSGTQGISIDGVSVSLAPDVALRLQSTIEMLRPKSFSFAKRLLSAALVGAVIGLSGDTAKGATWRHGLHVPKASTQRCLTSPFLSTGTGSSLRALAENLEYRGEYVAAGAAYRSLYILRTPDFAGLSTTLFTEGTRPAPNMSKAAFAKAVSIVNANKVDEAIDVDRCAGRLGYYTGFIASAKKSQAAGMAAQRRRDFGGRDKYFRQATDDLQELLDLKNTFGPSMGPNFDRASFNTLLSQALLDQLQFDQRVLVPAIEATEKVSRNHGKSESELADMTAMIIEYAGEVEACRRTNAPTRPFADFKGEKELPATADFASMPDELPIQHSVNRPTVSMVLE